MLCYSNGTDNYCSHSHISDVCSAADTIWAVYNADDILLTDERNRPISHDIATNYGCLRQVPFHFAEFHFSKFQIAEILLLLPLLTLTLTLTLTLGDLGFGELKISEMKGHRLATICWPHQPLCFAADVSISLLLFILCRLISEVARSIVTKLCPHVS